MNVCLRSSQVIQEEANDRVVVGVLSNALMCDGVQGSPADLQLEAVSVARLSDAITRAATSGCVSTRARLLLSTAQYVRRLRQAVLAQDWDQLESVLEGSSSRQVAPEAAAEVCVRLATRLVGVCVSLGAAAVAACSRFFQALGVCSRCLAVGHAPRPRSLARRMSHWWHATFAAL